jgi:hypothetical protein
VTNSSLLAKQGQKKAEEAVQERRVQEIELKLGATPLTPPGEAINKVDGTECSVVDDPEPRIQIALAVLERGLSPE